MIPRRSEVEHVLEDLRRLIETPKPGKDAHAWAVCSLQLSHLADQLAVKPDKVRMLVEIVTQLRASKVRSRRVIEERILEAMNDLADAAHAKLDGDDAAKSAEVLRELHDFAKACFLIKGASDAFGAKRRAAAFDILWTVGPMENSSEIMELAIRSIKEEPSEEVVCAALKFIEYHHAETETEPDDGLIDTVRGLIERTDSESVLIAGLDALVDWGVISEFEALTCLEDWRDEQDRNSESNDDPD